MQNAHIRSRGDKSGMNVRRLRCQLEASVLIRMVNIAMLKNICISARLPTPIACYEKQVNRSTAFAQ